MARKKGTKNKPKEIEKKKVKKEVEEIDSHEEQEIEQEQEQEEEETISEVEEEVQPVIKTDDIKPAIISKYEDKISKSDICKGSNGIPCGHNRNMHYDGLKGHCNTSGCVCDAFYS